MLALSISIQAEEQFAWGAFWSELAWRSPGSLSLS